MKSCDLKSKIAADMAKELMISVGTVLKYGAYALAMNDIFDQDITFAKNILSGKVRISHENIIELARLRPEEIRAIAKSSAEEKVDHITYKRVWKMARNRVLQREQGAVILQVIDLFPRRKEDPFS